MKQLLFGLASIERRLGAYGVQIVRRSTGSYRFRCATNTAVPRYVFEARDAKTSLPTGTVFGFIGYTGNMWMGAPPATDRAYTGNGRGLPAAHSHLWFAADPQNHKKLTTWAREALDYSGTYRFGGG